MDEMDLGEELLSLREWKKEQEEKIKSWSKQLEEFLQTILDQRKELEENGLLIERLEDRHSGYKRELGIMVTLANKWKTRAIENGWKKENDLDGIPSTSS